MTPTRKWLAARVTALAAFAVLVITNGFDAEARIVLVGLVAEAGVSYLTPNAEPTPVGGVGVGPDPGDELVDGGWQPVNPEVRKPQP